jgi:hypothetical protein
VAQIKLRPYALFEKPSHSVSIFDLSATNIKAPIAVGCSSPEQTAIIVFPHLSEEAISYLAFKGFHGLFVKSDSRNFCLTSGDLEHTFLKVHPPY